MIILWELSGLNFISAKGDIRMIVIILLDEFDHDLTS